MDGYLGQGVGKEDCTSQIQKKDDVIGVKTCPSFCQGKYYHDRKESCLPTRKTQAVKEEKALLQCRAHIQSMADCTSNPFSISTACLCLLLSSLRVVLIIHVCNSAPHYPVTFFLALLGLHISTVSFLKAELKTKVLL